MTHQFTEPDLVLLLDCLEALDRDPEDPEASELLRVINQTIERNQKAEARPSKTVTERLRDLLNAHPGVLTQPFVDLANEEGLGRNRARDFLNLGEKAGTIRVQREGRKRHHFWRGADAKADDADSQQPLPH